MQCLLAHLPELCNFLQLHRPHVVLIQETWLDNTVEEVYVPGYVTVSRRDRHSTANRGGVIILQCDDFNGLIQIRNCDHEERHWHFLRLDEETLLLGNWYRPGSSDYDGFKNLHEEIAEFFGEISGIVIAGDLNIHHKRWLRFSNANTQVGTELKQLCDYYGMWQAVREPSRNDYLLDLVLTDVQNLRASVTPYIADHKGIWIKLPFAEILEASFEREVWHLGSADWKSLRKQLSETDWSTLKHGTGEDALIFFLETIWYLLITHISRRKITVTKRSHPWLNEKSKEAIRRKNQAEGTEAFDRERKNCMQILATERARHVQALKDKLSSLPKCSKQWWRINRELLNRKGRLSSIPSLRDADKWLSDSKDKADLFAQTFASKAELPPEIVDSPFFGMADEDSDVFLAFRSRTCRRFFKQLDATKATGHDKISAAILKRLADELAVPFTLVVRRLFYEGCWPTM